MRIEKTGWGWMGFEKRPNKQRSGAIEEIQVAVGVGHHKPRFVREAPKVMLPRRVK